MISLQSPALLWVLLGVLVAASLLWLRIGERFSWPVRGAAFAVALAATLVVTLAPMELPEGFVPARYTLNPLQGFAEAFGLVADRYVPGMNQVWAIGNFFLWWPVVVTASFFLVRRRLMWFVLGLVLCIEVTQGVFVGLGRTFELSDVVGNVLGGWALVWWLERRRVYVSQS